MDAVILAAGKGSRLDGIAAPFHKPLLVVNGEPLIRKCVDLASEVAGQTIVVVAPENANAICQVLMGSGRLGSKVRVVVQPRPMGPGHALMLGLELVTESEVLVLMGDNVISAEDVKRIVNEKGNVIGTTSMSVSEKNERFTRLYDGKWIEKEPFSERERLDGYVTAWVGPIKVHTTAMDKAIRNWISTNAHSQGYEVPIGPLFNRFESTVTVAVSSIDLGVPEALV